MKLTLAEKNVKNKILCNRTKGWKMERFSKNKSTQTVSEQLEQVKQLSNLIINMSVKYYIYTNHNDCKIHI